ncbi:MAG: cold-shock protein [Bacteroidia bacterium]|jgi:CspA family cold shock protein
MKSGKVKFFNNEKGYGFIQDHATGRDVFVHKTGLTEDVRENDEVTFEEEEGKRGINAVNVKKA